jgi:G:T/U-mismatch repair DNA glycosylase
MPVEHTKEHDVEQARNLVARALSTTSEAEALTSFKKARKLLQRHKASQADVLGSRGPSSRNVAEEMRSATESVQRVAETVRNVAQDPAVQQVVSGLGSILNGIAGIGTRAKR